MAIKAILIPTSLKDKLTVVSITDFTDFYRHIGCRTFDLVSLDDDGKVSVDCYVDDEGMINGSPVNEYFLRAYQQGKSNQPLFGRGLVVMTDLDTGESIDLDMKAANGSARYLFIWSQGNMNQQGWSAVLTLA